MNIKFTDVNNLKGIRISVDSYFINKKKIGKIIKYRFKNILTVYNKGKNTIQIISNHKKISDLHGINYISKVFKNKPILKPGNRLKLESNYTMKTRIASIFGYFSIISLNSSSRFKAHIPVIKLFPAEILN